MTKTATIFDTIAGQIEDGMLPPGSKLAALRNAAEQFQVSKNTMVAVYDRLCAQGLIEARAGSGFYVADQRLPLPVAQQPAPSITQAVDRISLLRAQLGADFVVRVGDGRPPTSWTQGLIPARLGPDVLAELTGDHAGYGNVYGSVSLREQVVLAHRVKGIHIHPDNVLTTSGANHALDLVIRRLLSEGQTVLVDDPGYYPLFAKLSLHGLKVVGVPRTATGPDLDSLEALASVHSPCMFFTQSLCQNPTGTSLDLPTAHGVLQIAQKFGFTIVDNDPFTDLPGTSGTRLAQLDQGRSIIQIGSYSKLMSASIRVGYIVAPMELCERIAELKLITIVNTSGLTETLVAELLSSRRYERHLRRLEVRLAELRKAYVARVEGLGLQTLGGNGAGYYSYMLLPPQADEAKIVQKAAEQSIFLAPGRVFRANEEEHSTPALRINITRSEDSRFYSFLRKTLQL